MAYQEATPGARRQAYRRGRRVSQVKELAAGLPLLPPSRLALAQATAVWLLVREIGQSVTVQISASPRPTQSARKTWRD